MRRLCLSGLLAALAFGLVAGCGGGGEYKVDSYKTKVGPVSVEIIPPGEESNTTLTDDGGVVVSGDVRVEIHKLELTVNGKKYGRVDDTYDVVIKDGDVWVGGQVREPK